VGVQAFSPLRQLSIWLALDDADTENGCSLERSLCMVFAIVLLTKLHKVG
jgi:hypothetical protein